MFDKLNKLRGELHRARQKKAEIDAKIKTLENRLREAEEAQILLDVKQLNLSPEQLAHFLQMYATGQLPIPSTEELIALAGGPVYTDGKEDEDDEDLPF